MLIYCQFTLRFPSILFLPAHKRFRGRSSPRLHSRKAIRERSWQHKIIIKIRDLREISPAILGLEPHLLTFIAPLQAVLY